MNEANTFRPFTSAWDAPRPRRGRKGFVIAATAIFAAHSLLVAYLYKGTFEPRYVQPTDLPPVTATIVHPESPPPPPPPPISHPKAAAPPAHPRIAALPPVDIEQPDSLQLPPTDKPLFADPQPQQDATPHSETKPRVLKNPQFDRTPNADDLAQYYPERASRLGKEGAAVIRCTVTAKGALVGCAVISEAPQAYGFGDAALQLAKLFRLKPATADGVPVDGGVFSTRIAFRLPE